MRLQALSGTVPARRQPKVTYNYNQCNYRADILPVRAAKNCRADILQVRAAENEIQLQSGRLLGGGLQAASGRRTKLGGSWKPGRHRRGGVNGESWKAATAVTGRAEKAAARCFAQDATCVLSLERDAEALQKLLCGCAGSLAGLDCKKRTDRTPSLDGGRPPRTAETNSAIRGTSCSPVAGRGRQCQGAGLRCS